MEFATHSSPHQIGPQSVTRIMGLVLLALILGPTVVLAGWRRASAVVLFALLAVAGAILGLLRVPLPASSMIPLGTLLFLGTLLALDRHLPRRWTAPAAVARVPAGLWRLL